MLLQSYTAETSCEVYPVTSLSDGGTMNYKTGNLKEIITCKWCDADSTGIEYEPWGWADSTSSATNIDYKRTIRAVKDTITNYYRWGTWDDAYGTQGTWDAQSGWITTSNCRPPKTPQERLREIIQSRQSPLIVRSRKIIGPTEDVREQRARGTLRRVLGEDGFRAFVRNGFVSVKARSGLTYQIFPGHGMTNVYQDGEQTEKLCVVLRGSFPPTDSLIMRYLLILNDEQDFRKHAISHQVYPKNMTVPAVQAPKSLPELFRGMKVA